MKTMHRLVSILMVAALIFSLALTVSADANAEHTITITNADANDPHTYTAYQVFAGDYDAASGALSNVSWGSGVNGEALLADLKANVADFADCNNVIQVVHVLAGYGTGSEALRTFGAYVDKHLAAVAGTASSTPADSAAEPPVLAKAAVINVTGDGYYYVKDTSPSLATDTYSDYILLVEGDVTIQAKDTTGVTSFKKVKDINDSTLVGSGWQDSADYDIGDPVPFQLNGTVAADYAKYESYKLTFHDVQSAGLTFQPATVKAYVDGVEITEGFQVVTEGLTDGCTFEVRFANLKTIAAVQAGSLITVEYESILNDEAVIGEPGNPNVMCMEFSNNPTNPASTGKTPDDKVVVFTYEVIIDKVDEAGNLLPGAAFTLEKWIPNADIDPAALTDEMIGDPQYGAWVVVPGEVNGETVTTGDGEIIRINGKTIRKYTDTNSTPNREFYVIKDKPNTESVETDVYLLASEVELFAPIVAAGNEAGVDMYEMNGNGLIVKVEGNYKYALKSIERATTAGTTFTWNVVDDGHYRITETQTPAGFNSIEPIVFDVVASHSEESENPVLISVTGAPFVSTPANMGILHTNVVNYSGGVLPTTGGMGTTLLYILGALLVLGASVVLIVKKFSDA